MAKKTTPAPDQGKARNTAAKGAVAAAQDLKVAVDTVHGERSANLLDLLKETEEVVRATSFIEAQIDRQSELLARMKTEKTTIAAQHGALSTENAQLKSEVDALAKALGSENAAHRDLGKKSSTLKTDIAKFETQNEKLQAEIKSLEKSAERLKTDVERLEAIRKEYVERISKFREMREDLIR